MRSGLRSVLQRAPVLSALVVVMVSAQLAPVLTDEAAAQSRRRGRRYQKQQSKQGKRNPKRRQIRREDSLSPKKQVELDSDITKTEKVEADVDTSGKPSLTPQETQMEEMEELMDAKLDEEIQLSKELLRFETDCSGGAPVRFRLASLYWEKSKRAFFKSEDFDNSKAERRRYKQRMRSLQQRTVQNYQKILQDCPAYEDYDKTLFRLGRTYMEVKKPKQAARSFTRIIQEFPNSKWVPNAWFMVGEYYFNTKNEARKALRAYKRSAEYPKSSVFGFAVYKQGWCHINLGDWKRALDKFRQVVTVSEDPSRGIGPGQRELLRKEGLKDYVRAFSHIGSPRRAYRNFLRVGGRKAVEKMMHRLGQWYLSRDGHKDTITVYRAMLRRFPRSLRLPVYQGHILNATSRIGEKRETVRQAKLLTKYFAQTRRRLEKKELSEKRQEEVDRFMKEAEGIAENTLRRLATEYHKDARKMHGKAARRMFTLASKLYSHYLSVFPEPDAEAEVNYVFFIRFYYAEVLYELEDFLQSARNYDAVVDMNPHPDKEREKNVVLSAAEDAVRAYDELVKDLDRKNPPEISGTKPKKIPQIKQDLIHACRRYIDYVGTSGEKIVEIRYKMARIYYTYNHFDKAAPAFDDIVANHPGHEVACYAANLALDIYNGLKDYEHLRQASRSYLANEELACGEEDRQKFAKIEQQSTFKLIKMRFEDKKNHIAAANRYMKFYRNFPKSEWADDAVYNAAVNYDKGNKLNKANEVRQFLVEKLPDSELVPETLYNIAQSYERVVDFKKAAHYLNLFAERYPDDERSKDAIYNAGLYRATLREFDASRRDRKRFIRLYPEDDSVPDVAFSICETLDEQARQMEKRARQNGRRGAMDKAIREKWIAAHDCYFEWVKNDAYVSGNPDMLCHAQFRRGEIMRTKTKYTKGYYQQKKYVLSNWPRWKRKHGKEALGRCAADVSQLRFRDLRPRFKKYRSLRISQLNPARKKRFDASVKAKVKRRDALIKDYQKIAQIGVAEWSLAALFHIGEAYYDSIQKVLDAPIPKKIPGYTLTDEDKKMLRQQLQQMVAPIEKRAIDAFRVCVDKANELGVYNRWSMKALNRLQELRPERYPPVVERLVPVELEHEYTVATNTLLFEKDDELKTASVELEVPPPPKPKPTPADGEQPGSPKGDDASGQVDGGVASAQTGG